jgi:eukaryotic-like serine/threonine-protein kinase
MGRYRIVKQIGEGSTGAIYDGEYGPLARPVAIKILHEHLVGDPSARRMVEEARTLSMLDHPGIVKVFDVGMLQGRAFIVMERLTGEPLSSRLARERLGEERIVVFARQLASALEAAHAVGIVHRDLKPENIFVVPDPEVPSGERVKIIDFGIAKHEHIHERTATGIVLGTPTYMAPEQWDRAVDPRADIYSLGVVIYVMATGELPFSGTTNELLAEHAYCAPPRASTSGLVSSWLSSIIERCLAKRPADRFPTMTALAVALRELEQAIAAPTGPTPRCESEDDEDEVTIAAPRATQPKAVPLRRPVGLWRWKLVRWPMAVAIVALSLVAAPAPAGGKLLQGSALEQAEPQQTLTGRWSAVEREVGEESRRAPAQRRGRRTATR